MLRYVIGSVVVLVLLLLVQVEFTSLDKRLLQLTSRVDSLAESAETTNGLVREQSDKLTEFNDQFFRYTHKKLDFIAGLPSIQKEFAKAQRKLAKTQETQ